MNKTHVELIDIDENWDKEVSNYNFDIYHLSAWLNTATVIDGGKPKGIIAQYENKKILFPIIVRNIDNEYWDATSTYGYGGPLFDKTLTNNDIDTILEDVRVFLHQKGCVSLFMRLHTIINKDWLPTVGTALTHGLTLASDLTKSEDEHWKETQNQHRRGIKKSLKMGVTTAIETFTVERAMVFSNIYQETMKSVNAGQYYFFNDDYFYDLSKSLQDRLLLVTAYKDDLAIASSLYTTCEESGIMQYHLGGTLDDHRNLQPSKLITHIAREWGRQNNYKVLHLGGGVGAKLDALYQYKKGFSSQELLFKTYRLVVNTDKYEELVADIELGEDELSSDYFPLYRKKMVQENA
ncbi:peptidoglycan bridge formation glycyltransferase FemA/FemB family protein [Psychrobacter fulvigenes]|uniref:peptidoglycan bridge formation glycyltransferase FemA/FemB family protein n=1 Tax=Psychrobacter fulvigenes TaxID=533323 RepID=UPI0019191255|nr:peptidoglycan bridge formation glycyltransferase FemA/FemB family protein [Psychrobacter fulvigenes]